MSKKIMISENELHDIIFEAVNNYMVNEGMEEGFFKNLGAGLSAGKNAKIDYHKNNQKDAIDVLQNNMGQRIQAAKKGFNLQKQYSRMDKLKQELQQLVNDKVISPKQTVNQLINWSVGTKQNQSQGAKGLAGAKGDYQRQATAMGMKALKETVEKIMNEYLKDVK